MNLAHEILLTLAYVSQISDPDLVRLRFFESLNGLDEGFSFEFADQLPSDVPEYRILPIATLSSSFGYAVMAESPEPEENELALFKNAFQFLAALLENRNQARALESRNESLMEEINIEKSLVRTVLDTLPIGVWVADENGTILAGNPAGEKIWGRTHYVGIDQYGEYKARQPDTGKNIEPEEWGIARAIKAGEIVIDQEMDIESFNGTHKTILHSAAPLLTGGQRVIGAVGVNQDITDRKKSEAALNKAVERLNLAARAGHLGIWDWDIQNNTLAWDDGMYRLYGIKKEHFSNVYDAWLNGLHPDDRAENDRITEAAKRGEREYDTEFRILWPDGTIRFIKALGQVIWDSNGHPKRMTGINYDITERKKMENSVQQSQKMEAIGTLAGGIAHDFNNILSPIVGHTEMLLEDVPADSPLRESLNEIYTSSLRARDLVQQILAFSRQGRNELKLVKMQPIIKEALKLIRSTIPATISIHQDLQLGCGAVNADPTQIHQIIMNLATNAYHAMEENGGELKVTLKEIKSGEHELFSPDMASGSYACLTIADTGMGMDENVIDKIFEPFFTTKEKGKGTGMGLSVVHGIVKSMNGTIRVYSEPFNGTEFHVCLPVVMTASEKKEAMTNEPMQGGTERVLLVDDEKGIVTMEKQILVRLGYQVTSHTSSIEAFEAFRTDPDKFDIVISDMAMPKMPGDKLAVELIKIRNDIPILLCTGFSEFMSEEKIKILGIKGLLLKPIIMRDLAQKIRNVLDEPGKVNL